MQAMKSEPARLPKNVITLVNCLAENATIHLTTLTNVEASSAHSAGGEGRREWCTCGDISLHRCEAPHDTHHERASAKICASEDDCDLYER